MIIRIFLTWLLALPVMAQFAVTNHAILSVSPSGINATAIRGRMDRPWFSISNAVAAAQNGDTVLMLPGRYTNALFYSNTVYGFSIHGINKTNLTVAGSGPGTVIYAPGIGSLFNFTNCPGLRLRDFTIDQAKPATSTGQFLTNGAVQAINITGAGVSDTLIERVRLVNIANHGINDMYDLSGRGVKVFNSYFENIGATSGVPSITHDGASVQLIWHESEVVDCTFTNVGKGVEIYSGVNELAGLKILGNRMTAVNLFGIWIAGSGCFGLQVENNYIEGDYGRMPLSGIGDGIVLQNSRGGVFIGNTCHRFSNSGFNISSSLFLGNVVSGNTVFGCPSGISMFGSTTNFALNQIVFNVLYDIGGTPISVNGVHNTIGWNHIRKFNTNGTAFAGIRSYFSNTNMHNRIIGNFIAHGNTAISIGSADVRTNIVSENLSLFVTTHISDSGTATVNRDNSN